jgi:addiction module RelE/StbE family toxin
LKIHWKDEFKEDYTRLETQLKRSVPLRKALFRAISMLQQGKELSEHYAVNRIPAQGMGWYDCYVYDNIIMIYKIEGQYVKLSRLGTPEELEKER